MFQDESGLAILSFINSHSAQNIPLGTTPQLPYYLQECRRHKCKYTAKETRGLQFNCITIEWV